MEISSEVVISVPTPTANTVILCARASMLASTYRYKRLFFGLNHFPKSGEVVLGSRLQLGLGVKYWLARVLKPHSVAFLCRSFFPCWYFFYVASVIKGHPKTLTWFYPWGKGPLTTSSCDLPSVTTTAMRFLTRLPRWEEANTWSTANLIALPV